MKGDMGCSYRRVREHSGIDGSQIQPTWKTYILIDVSSPRILVKSRESNSTCSLMHHALSFLPPFGLYGRQDLVCSRDYKDEISYQISAAVVSVKLRVLVQRELDMILN